MPQTETPVSQLKINRLTKTQFDSASDLSATALYAVDPEFTGGKLLKTDSNGDIVESTATDGDTLPSQSGQSGKFLTTDGSSASWVTVTIPVVESYISGNGIDVEKVLPSGYTQLEYIESSGTQYIDTGIAVNNNNSFEFEAAFLSGNSDAYFISQGNVFLRISTASMTWYTRNYHYLTSMSTEVFYNISCGFNFLKVNGTDITGTADSDIVSGTNVCIFAKNDGSAKCKSKLKRIKIFNPSSDLVFDGIPCKRNLDGIIGIFNRVGQNFITNSGTGTFSSGQELPIINTISANIVSSVDSSSTNSEAAGAKLFYDTCGDIETLINAL